MHPYSSTSHNSQDKEATFCSSTDEWIKKCGIYAVEYYSSTKKNKLMPFAATWMDLEIVILSKVKEKYFMISLICRILKNDTNELIYKTETDSENDLIVTMGEGWEEG